MSWYEYNGTDIPFLKSYRKIHLRDALFSGEVRMCNKGFSNVANVPKLKFKIYKIK
jgi:hypothetical protein